MLTFMCCLLAVVTVLFLLYRWQEQVNGRNSRPIIDCPSYPLRVSVAALKDKSLLMSDVTAMDKEEGDITSSMVVESISQFLEPGHSLITYVAFDSRNKVARATRHLYLTDYTSPTFEITDPLEFSYSTNFTPLSCIRAYDCIDGDISNRIKMTMLNGDDELGNIGAHNVEFSITNSLGDVVKLPAEVVVYDRTYTEMRLIPVIRLQKYLVYVDPNTYIDFEGEMVESIGVMGDKYSVEEYESKYGKLEVDDGGFDPNEPGIYRVLYTCDYNGEYVGSAVLIVVVREGEIRA